MPQNYQLLFEKAVSEVNYTPRLLLHVCCAPCATRALEVMSPYFSIDILFYNPNIQPKAEYEKRLFSLELLLKSMPLPNAARLLGAPYRGGDFSFAAAGYEQEPEGGARCSRCFELRLREAGKLAREGGYDFFSTTLTVGPRKSAEVINELGFQISGQIGVPWLPADFKKRDGYRRSVELSGKYGLYRQNYCGCRFSKTLAF